MSRNELAQEWQERLDEFEQANTSIVDFCFRHRIPQHQFFYWRRRLASQPTNPPAPLPTFVPVQIAHASTPAAPTGVTLHLAGASIQLTADFDPTTLRAVVVALSGLPPC